ncbi:MULTISPECIES: hypothetical protein [unclassified Facklamia]|uniref:hypothetical protein n=1 Tax=Aerococcaceae TaxID=186827 RepID=UPI0013B9AE45|nr:MULTISPECIES: hypothetical protein [unclassified Facklamia]NEW64276.1 hypothetical protein [Facklamia sp. 252]NEW67887.1 hypothetical protein [Facklamia sp. 253]QQD64742.1 hypothetical protein JDW14_05230 [Aerococcaceae bacterium zg-252]
MNDLVKKVIEWHEEKQTNDIEKQSLYLVAEFGEFVGAYLKNDRAEMIDGLGDTLVVLIGLAHWTGNELDWELELDRVLPALSPNERIAFGTNTLSSIQVGNVVLTQGCPDAFLNKFLKDLRGIALSLDLNLKECLQSAYDVISKRTGKTVDGVFIKDGEA